MTTHNWVYNYRLLKKSSLGSKNKRGALLYIFKNPRSVNVIFLKKGGGVLGERRMGWGREGERGG